MKYIKLIILTFSIALLNTGIIDAQNSVTIEIQSTVLDNTGNPISDAIISAQEGRYFAKTDNSGTFKIKCSPDATILIEARGFKSVVLNASLFPQSVALEEMPFQMTESDFINIPFGRLNQRQVVGAISTINPEDFEKTDGTQSLSSAMASRGIGLFGGKDIRGIGYTIIVDGMKRGNGATLETFSDMLNLQEIGKISILKDASSRALYGSHAEKGIILITTKRGLANKRRIAVHAEKGIADPVSFPQYLNGADYMDLLNEALTNDGLTAKYDQITINNTRSGIDQVKYTDENYYNSELLKSFKPFSKIITEFSGGNSKNQYYLNAGWGNEGSLLKIGEGLNEKSNSINIRGNINIEINKWIKASVDAVSLINFYHRPNYRGGDFWSLASSIRPVDFTALLPIDRIIAANSSLVETATKINDNYILGGNSLYTNNIYGDLYSGGYVKGMKRITQINMGIDIDLSFIIPEMKFKTYFGYDNFNTFETIQSNSYAIYEPAFTPDDSISITKIGIDNFVGSQSTQAASFYRMFGWSNILSYRNTFNESHTIDVTAATSIDAYQEAESNYSNKHINAGIRVNYMFRNKYIAEFDGSLVGSPRFEKGDRWGFAPVFGLAWIASEEEFLKNSSLIDYLKVKGTYGNLKTDIDNSFATYYMYQDMYKLQGSFGYGDGSNSNLRTQIVNIGNRDITWIERNELNLGLEASMLDNSLFAEINYFNSKRFNEISQMTNINMSFLGGTTFLPYLNYGSRVEQGFEAGINYKGGSGDFRYNIGMNLVNINPVLKKVDELNYGPDLKYRQQQGKAADAIWGYEAIGLFADDPDIQSSPVQTFGNVNPGDIKYRDISGDGIIDEDDQIIIGYSHARYNCVLSINLSYRNFDLFTYLSAQSGKSGLYNNYYYWVFGDKKYPEFLTDRWAYDPGKGIDTRNSASYPRLSSRSNSNNLRNSTYWLAGEDYLSVPVMQLTYSLPGILSSKIYTRDLSIFARATNVLMVARNKEKMQLNTTSEPQMRLFSIGLKAQF